MPIVTRTISILALAAIVLLCGLYFLGRLELDTVKIGALVATVLWFATTPLWVGRKPTGAS